MMIKYYFTCLSYTLLIFTFQCYPVFGEMESVPKLISPLNGLAFSDREDFRATVFRWESVPNADTYTLYIEERAYASTTEAYLTVDLREVTPCQRFEWYVIAENEFQLMRSETSAFSFIANDLRQMPHQLIDFSLPSPHYYSVKNLSGSQLHTFQSNTFEYYLKDSYYKTYVLGVEEELTCNGKAIFINDLNLYLHLDDSIFYSNTIPFFNWYDGFWYFVTQKTNDLRILFITIDMDIYNQDTNLYHLECINHEIVDSFPSEYIENPEQLAEAYDIIFYGGVYGNNTIDWKPEYAQTIIEYVEVYGKTFVFVAEWQREMTEGIKNMNELLANRWGANFIADSIYQMEINEGFLPIWGEVDYTKTATCDF